MNCVALNGLTNTQKAAVAFNVFDHDNTNQITYDEFVCMVFWVNLRQMNDKEYKSVTATVTKIFQDKRLNRTDPLTKRAFNEIINEHQSIILTNRFA